MKKATIIKIIITIIVIFIALFLINLVRNYTIVSKICEENTKFASSLSNYYYEYNSITTNREELNSRQELFVYNGIYLQKFYMNNKLLGINWIDNNTSESISLNENGNIVENSVYERITSEYKNVLLNGNAYSNEVKAAIIMENLFNPILTKDSCYSIKFNKGYYYIDKETKLIKKMIMGDSIVTFNIIKGTMTEDNVQKPSFLH